MDPMHRIHESIRLHAKRHPGDEVCGFVVKDEGQFMRVVEATNDHPCPSIASAPDARTMLDVAASGNAVMAYHSHPDGPAQASDADRALCDRLEMPLLIYSVPDDRFVSVAPTPRYESLLGREFNFGTADCFVLVRDFYAMYWPEIAKKISLDWRSPDFVPGVEPEEKWFKPFIASAIDAGFYELTWGESARFGDVLVFGWGQDRHPRHLGVYLSAEFIHHPVGGLSRIEPLRPQTRQHVCKVFRHPKAVR